MEFTLVVKVLSSLDNLNLNQKFFQIIVTPPSTPNDTGKDGVEDVLQQCLRAAEDRKKKILAAYDIAARSGPAGVVKGVDFEPLKNSDCTFLNKFQLNKFVFI